MLAKSALELNREIVESSEWLPPDIERRSLLLAERVIEIWERPLYTEDNSPTTGLGPAASRGVDLQRVLLLVAQGSRVKLDDLVDVSGWPRDEALDQLAHLPALLLAKVHDLSALETRLSPALREAIARERGLEDADLDTGVRERLTREALEELAVAAKGLE